MGAAAIPVVMGVSTLISAGVSAYSQNEQSKAQARALRRQQDFALLQAADVERMGAREAGQIRQQGSRVIGEQRLAQAAAGVDGTSGTAARLAAEARGYSDLDAEMVKNNAARQAWGLRTHGAMLGQQASDVRAQGKLNAGMTLLGGAVNAAAAGYAAYKPSTPTSGQRLMGNYWGEDNLAALDRMPMGQGW